MVCVPLAVVAIKTVQQVRCATILNVRIHVKLPEFVVRMLSANSITMSRPVNVPLVSKVIQHLNKVAFVSPLLAWPQINVQLVICVLETNVTFHVPIIYLVPLVNGARTISAPKFVIPTTTAYRVKFVTIKERVNRAVHPTVIVQQHRSA